MKTEIKIVLKAIGWYFGILLGLYIGVSFLTWDWDLLGFNYEGYRVDESRQWQEIKFHWFVLRLVMVILLIVIGNDTYIQLKKVSKYVH